MRTGTEDPYLRERQVPIEDLVPLLGPAKLEIHGEHIQYLTPLGRLSITPQPGDRRGDLWHFFKGSLSAAQHTVGAINFVIATGLAHDLHSAKALLSSYAADCSVDSAAPKAQTDAGSTHKKPYTAPRPVYVEAENQRALQAYLG